MKFEDVENLIEENKLVPRLRAMNIMKKGRVICPECRGTGFSDYNSVDICPNCLGKCFVEC